MLAFHLIPSYVDPKLIPSNDVPFMIPAVHPLITMITSYVIADIFMSCLGHLLTEFLC